MPGFVEGIYVAHGAGAPVERVGEVAAIEGCGLAGDRYCTGTGHWSRFGRVCQVTLIAAEDLDAIEKETGIRVRDGEHRRNIVLRGLNLGDLRRRRFRIGGATLEYVGPRNVLYARSEVRSTLYSRLPANLAHPARAKAAAIGALSTSVSACRGFSFPSLLRASRSVAVPAASRSSMYPRPLISGTTPT